jgi:hypothetical protein
MKFISQNRESAPPRPMPTLTTDLTDEFAAQANINLDGTIPVTNFSTETTVNPVSAVPELGTLALVGTGRVACFRDFVSISPPLLSSSVEGDRCVPVKSVSSYRTPTVMEGMLTFS